VRETTSCSLVLPSPLLGVAQTFWTPLLLHSLEKTNIGAKGAGAIGEALKHNRTLKGLV
jgi:hypothetical protein